MSSQAVNDVITIVEETLYNTNLAVDVILALFSVVGCWFIFKHARVNYKHLQEERAKVPSYETRHDIYNLRTVYVRDLFLFFISLDEAGQKGLEIIDYIILQVRGRPYVISPNLTNSCVINPVSSLGFYYHRGPGYYFLFALINTTDIILLVLLNALTLFLIKSYSEHPQWRSLIIYIISSMVLAAFTLIITPIQYTLILGNLLYALIILVQFILLIILTRRLYLVLRQRKLEVVSQRLSARVIKHQQMLQTSYKYFSVSLLIVLLIYMSGQWLEIILVTFIGSLIENACWFGVVFGIHFSIPYNPTVFEPFKLISIYGQFLTMLIMNFVLSLIYISYFGYAIYRAYSSGRAPHIRYTTVATHGELETSLIDH